MAKCMLSTTKWRYTASMLDYNALSNVAQEQSPIRYSKVQ